jgi:hypothetical protein
MEFVSCQLPGAENFEEVLRFLENVCTPVCVCVCVCVYIYIYVYVYMYTLSIKLYGHLRTAQNAKIQTHLNVMLYVHPLSCFKNGRSPSKNRFAETLHRGNELNGKKGCEI